MYSSVLEAILFFSLGFLFQQLSVLGCLTIDNDVENAQFLRERELRISPHAADYLRVIVNNNSARKFIIRDIFVRLDYERDRINSPVMLVKFLIVNDDVILDVGDDYYWPL